MGIFLSKSLMVNVLSGIKKGIGYSAIRRLSCIIIYGKIRNGWWIKKNAPVPAPPQRWEKEFRGLCFIYKVMGVKCKNSFSERYEIRYQQNA